MIRTMRLVGLSGVVCLALAASTLAQSDAPTRAFSESQGTPEARKAHAEGRAAQARSDTQAAADAFRRAIDLDPAYVEAHSSYLFAKPQAAMNYDAATGKGDREAAERARAELRAFYRQRAEAEPSNPIYQWAQGQAAGNYVEAEKYYLKAVEREPRFARPYQDLALIAEFRGDQARELEYRRKAAELNPDDPQYLFYYASSVRDDEALYRRLSLEVAEKFPAHERGAQALYWLAIRAKNPGEKAATLERLRRDFPPEKFSWSQSGLFALYGHYAETDPPKARDIVQQMATRAEGRSKKTWDDLLAYDTALVEARASIAAGKGADAVARLKDVKPPRMADPVAFELLQAEALAATGDAAGAYARLVQRLAKEPNAAVREAALRYAAAAGKSGADLAGDVWARRDEAATPASPFTLHAYRTGKPVSLSDYAGKVVLVNFWYPACGPCRGEFPYLQKVVERFKGRDFHVLALNGHPEEDPFVLPFMDGNRYDFFPLRATEDVVKAYGVRGYPANFLIDRRGRVMARPWLHDDRTQAVLEQQIEELLNRPAATPTPSGGF